MTTSCSCTTTFQRVGAALLTSGPLISRSCARRARFEAAARSAVACACAKEAPAREITGHIGGYIRIRAVDLEAAQALVVGNPVYEAGGTVEIRELTKDD